ncbi:MAG TPA: hypothetical protein VI759_05860 [Dehalococcoidia bacterium]|nr:hypothetical protein [Dehalococcoidia bacterium]
MNQTYVQIDLGASAITYLRERLSNGKTLSKLLEQAVDLDQGAICIFLPPESKLDHLEQFKWGGKLAPPPPETHTQIVGKDGTRWIGKPVPNTDAHLDATCLEHLRRNPVNICLFEKWMSKPSDPWVEREKPRFLFLDEEMYFFATAADGEDGLHREQRGARDAWPPLLGVLARKPDSLALPVGRGAITEKELAEIATTTENIIVEVYDGEAYLLWTKTPPA